MLSIISLVALFVTVLLAWLAQRFAASRKLKGLPRVGIEPGFLRLRLPAAKAEFFEKAQQLMEQGYALHKDTPYIIQTVDNERLVVPDKFIDELKNLPDTQISFKEELLDRFMGKYTKMDAVRGSNIHREVVISPLTKTLGNLLPKMKEEAEVSLSKTLKDVSTKEFTPVSGSGLIFNAIGQVTSRILVDESFARDPAWLETIMGYTASVAIFSMKMRTINPLFRPIAYWTLSCGQKLRADIKKVEQFLIPVIQQRQTHPPEKQPPQDIVQWFLSHSSPKENNPTTMQPSEIVLKMLFLIVAAMHTTATTAIHALYDLTALPPTFAAELRAEAQTQIATHGWNLTALLKLRKMDSFLKESGRMNSAGIVSFQRLVLAPITLSNGFTIPANTHICAASDARSRDPALYDDPTAFRPLRFYDEHAADVDSAKLFSSVVAGDSWFGFGRQACPGRGYASALIKLVLCSLLLEYEVEFPEGQTERPKNWVKDEKTGPDMGQVIMLKRREG